MRQNTLLDDSFREIFDRKKLTNTHTHTQTEKAKTIYPLYTSYAGGIMRMIESKMKELECSQDFSHYKSMGIFPDAQGQLTPQSLV